MAGENDAEMATDEPVQPEMDQVNDAPDTTSPDKPEEIELQTEMLENLNCSPHKLSQLQLGDKNDAETGPQLVLKNMNDTEDNLDESIKNLAAQSQPSFGSQEDLQKGQPTAVDASKTDDLLPLPQEPNREIDEGMCKVTPHVAIDTCSNSILDLNSDQPTVEPLKSKTEESTERANFSKVNLAEPDEAAASDVEIASLGECSSKEKTGKWLEDIVAFEKREILRKKLQLSPSVLNKVPTLSNETSAFVELDLNSEHCEMMSGAKQLMERMLKCRQRLFRGPVSLTTTIAERDAAGHISNISVETIPLTAAATVKPGAKLQQLREKLRNEIEAKWEEEFKKRCHSATEKSEFEDDVENIEDEAEEAECDSACSSGSESEPEEEDIEIKEKPRKFCSFGDSEAEESAGEGDDEGGSSDDDVDDEKDNLDNEKEDCDDEENSMKGDDNWETRKIQPEEKKGLYFLPSLSKVSEWFLISSNL